MPSQIGIAHLCVRPQSGGQGTPITNLWPSLLERMDVRVLFIGDSTGALSSISSLYFVAAEVTRRAHFPSRIGTGKVPAS